MASNIDPTLDGTLDDLQASVSKPALKGALTTAAAEITDLQENGGGVGGGGTDGALLPADLAGGAITAAIGALNLVGTSNYVLKLDGAGNVSPASPMTVGGLLVDDLVAGSNVTLVTVGSTKRIDVSSGTATVDDGAYGDIVITDNGGTYTIAAGVVTLAKLATAVQDSLALADSAFQIGDIAEDNLDGAPVQGDGAGGLKFGTSGIANLSVEYTADRSSAAEIVLDDSNRPTTAAGGTINAGGAMIVRADTQPAQVRIYPGAGTDYVAAIVVDPDSTYPVTLERTQEIVDLTGDASGTTITSIDTRSILEGQSITVFRDTGTTGEFGDPILEQISDPTATIDSITLVSENGSLELDIAVAQAETGAIIEVAAGEQGLINGETTAPTLLPGTTIVRVLARDPWMRLTAEGPGRGRFELGTTITDDFTLDASYRGKTFQVDKATDVTCTLNAVPAEMWADFIVRGVGKLIFADGTATADYATGKVATVPSKGSVMVRAMSETDIWLTGSLEDAS